MGCWAKGWHENGSELMGRKPTTDASEPPGPRLHRNTLWEGACLEVALQVNLGGEPCRPWITWFADCGTQVVVGAGITPRRPSRESILAALQTAVSRTGRFAAAGGVPARIRMDHAQEALARTVREAMTALEVEFVDPPFYAPDVKEVVETLHDALERDLFTRFPRGIDARATARDASPAVTFEAFHAAVLEWIEGWNTGHDARPGRLSPLEAWNADPALITDATSPDLVTFMTASSGRESTVTTHGIIYGGMLYSEAWMAGRVGQVVKVRSLPLQCEQIEVYTSEGDERLGSAYRLDPPTGATALA